jgi:uncharacterized membrane protein YhaH (DUF805 family)
MISFYLKINGRISRKAMWLAVMFPFLAMTYLIQYLEKSLIDLAPIDFLGTNYNLGSSILLLLLAWPWFATSIKRFHDLKMSGWWSIFFVPGYFWFPDILALDSYSSIFLSAWGLSLAVSFILGLMQLFTPGTRGENKYGPDPLEKN